MKQKIFLLFFLTLLVLHHSDARFLLANHQESKGIAIEGKVNYNKIKHEDEGSFLETTKDIDLFELMGSEKCDEKDEECMKRRIIAEAHLDYIYTQNHNP